MLTREYIMNLEAGREMDALVAEKVFGKNVQWTFGDEWTDSYPVDVDNVIVDHYSTDISAAFEVLEKMKDHGQHVRIADQSAFYKVRFSTVTAEKTEWLMARELPLAICRASLLTTIQGEENNA